MADSKVVARINVRDIHIAFMTKDDNTGADFEDPILIPGAMQVQLAPRVSTADLYGDGRIRHRVNKVGGYDVTLDHNMIPPKVLARMLGQKYDDNGIRRSNTLDQGENFAVGWVVDLIGEDMELTWLPKCVVAPSNRNMQQSTESINYSTDSMTVTAMPLEYNNDFEYIADTSDAESGFTKTDASEWFKEVVVMPPLNPAGTGTGPSGP
jgi:phi13 family phage major tail protein